MALAVFIGAVAGFVGFVPLFAALRFSRKSTSVAPLNAAAFGLAGVFVSLIVLAVELFVCSQVARDQVLPFGIAEMLTLVIATAVYVTCKNVLGRKKGTKGRK